MNAIDSQQQAFLESLQVSAMVADRWEQFGNKLDLKARMAWTEIAKTFNAHRQGKASGWSVIPAETGAGKSLTTQCYAAWLAQSDYPEGMLIVSRLKKQCDEMADAINTTAGRQVAVARHSAANTSLDDQQAAQVLCTTHKAFEVGMSQLELGRGRRWLELMTMIDGNERSLVVVDESLDNVHLPRICGDDIYSILTAIRDCRGIDLEPGVEARTKCSLMRILDATLTTPSGADDPQTLTMATELFDADLDLQQLEKDVEVWIYALQAAPPLRSESNTRARANAIRALDTLAQVIDSFGVFNRNTGQIYTASTVLPPTNHPPVVLDATARINRVYDHMRAGGLELEIVNLPQIRRYDAVTVHVARMHTGKTSVTSANGLSNLKAAQANLEAQRAIEGWQKPLVITHKDVESHWAGFSNYETAHYGAVDGLNAYADCDCVLLWGQLHRDTTELRCAIMGLSKQIQDNAWLNDRTTQEVRDYEVGAMATAAIQAIMRGRLRRITREGGGCETTHVYLTIPHGLLGDALLDQILTALPGATVLDWVLDLTKTVGRPKRADSYRAMMVYLEGLKAGETATPADVRRGTGLTTKQLQGARGISKGPEATAKIKQKMLEAGVRVDKQGNSSVFVRI